MPRRRYAASRSRRRSGYSRSYRSSARPARRRTSTAARRTGRSRSASQRIVIQLVGGQPGSQALPIGMTAAPAPRTRKF